MSNGFLGAPKSFSSWVPTVTGKLSYTILGRTDWPRRCIYVNQIQSPEHCYAIFLQERFTHDFLLPFLGLSDRTKNFLFGLSFFGWRKPTIGRHYFVCIVDKGENFENDGEIKNLDKLCGTIHVVPATPNGKGIFNKLKQTISNLSQTKLSKETIEALRTMVIDESPLNVSFSLRRNGEFKLNQTDITNVKQFGMIGNKEADRYSAQMYYFFRDIVHNHQHHEAANDLIVNLHPDEGNDWKDKVYFDLFRRVIAFKRIRTDFHITNATGILAYASTFKKMFKPPSSGGDYYEKETIQSLETAKYELQLKQLRRSNFVATFQAWLFGLLASLFGFIAISGLGTEQQTNSIKVNETVYILTRLFTAYPFQTGVATTLICFMATKFLGYSKPEKKGYIKDTLRVFNYWKKSISVALQIITGMLILIIVFFLLSTIT